MNANGFDVKALLSMAHSPVRNYAIPGLTSSLIGAPSSNGTVRLFECEREHQEPITPHSHRFDFQCWVLRGEIRNRIWTTTWSHSDQQNADEYQSTVLRYSGEFGKYERESGDIKHWKYEDSVFSAGECYSMRAHQVHSIFFSRGARVLFFEGRTIADTSIIIEPVVGGEVVPTFRVEPWMFQRDKSGISPSSMKAK